MTIALATTPRSPSFYGQHSTSRSQSGTIDLLCSEIRRHLSRSVTLSGPTDETLRVLDAARTEASVDGWNGYGGKRIDPFAYWEARRFVQALPLNTPKPDISVDGDGEVSFDWLLAPRLAFSVSVSGRGRLTYGSLRGFSAVQGTEWLDDAIPSRLLEELALVVRENQVTNAA